MFHLRKDWKALPINGSVNLSEGSLIVAVIPAYNEQQRIGKVVSQVKRYVDRVIVCDDGSVDATGSVAKKSGATVVRHRSNLGYGAALSTLFEEARKLNPDAVVTLDADGQHHAAYIPRLVKPILNDNVDIVIGSRFLSSDGKVSLPAYRRVGIRLITKLANRASYTGITDSQSGYRAYSREALQVIHPSETGMGVSTEILIEAKKSNLRVVEMPTVVSYDGETSTHNPVTHWSKVLLSTVKNITKNNSQIFYGAPGIGALLLAALFWGEQQSSMILEVI